MDKLKKVLMLLAVLAMATSAQGSPKIYPVTGLLGGEIDVQILYLGPAMSAVLGPLDVWEVHLVDARTPNDSVSSVDVDIIPHPPTNPLGLAQVHAFGGALATPDMQFASILSPGGFNVDTHFNLWDPGSANFPQWNAMKTPATENMAAVGLNAAGEMEGWGTSLSVISALTPIATDLNLVQVGLPVGMYAILTGTVNDGRGEEFRFMPEIGGGPIIIPEPTTGLLLLAGVLLIVRKRRQAPS